jgi:hypothetical protein
MNREYAEVASGGRTIGFAYVEVNATWGMVGLAHPVLLAAPSVDEPEATAERSCPCGSEGLEFALVKSLSGPPWFFGVKVCPVHRSLHAA